MSELERLRASESCLRDCDQEPRLAELRRANDELQVALAASDLLVGAAMDVAERQAS